MRCPVCDTDMITGEIVCKAGAGPTLYPRKPGDSDVQYFAELFFGGRDPIRPAALDEGWYCPKCEKIIVIWSAKPKEDTE